MIGIGYNYEGRLKEYELDKGEYIDIDVYSLLRKNFYERWFMQEYKFSIVPWVSWKTYFVNDIQTTIIFEQQTEYYYLLDDTLSVCGMI